MSSTSLRSLFFSTPLTLLLSGCFGDGKPAQTLYFSVNSDAACSFLQLGINLVDADAEILRDDDGGVRCELDDALDEAGCTVSYVEIADSLFIDVTACTVPATAAVAECLFSNAVPRRLQSNSASQCDCVEPCDNEPPVCVAEQVDSESCEATQPPSTSSTSTSSSTSQTSMTSSTSVSVTHTFGNEICRITFRLEESMLLGALQWNVDYSALSGVVVGTGANVECATLVEGTLASFNDNDFESTLSAGLVSLSGFQGPLDIAECSISVPFEPTSSDFLISVLETTDTDSQPLEPLPQIDVSLDCSSF